MSTSGSENFTMTRNQIVASAMQAIGKLAPGETPSSEEMDFGVQTLNLMVKGYALKGIHLWTTEEATLFPVFGQASYILGGSSGADCTTSYEQTTLRADATSAVTTISLTDVTGISVGDNLGVMKDDDTIDWQTVSAVSAGASTVTMTTVLSADVSSGNTVYAYTTKIGKALRVTDVIRRDTSDIDVPLVPMARQQYLSLSNKTSTGTPTNFYLDAQRDYSTLKLWPTPEDELDKIIITYQRHIQDFDASTDNADFPTEWLNVLKWGLASEIGPTYGIPDSIQARVDNRYAVCLSEAEGYDQEQASVFFQPDNRWGR